jgi:hypothetical protein
VSDAVADEQRGRQVVVALDEGVVGEQLLRLDAVLAVDGEAACAWPVTPAISRGPSPCGAWRRRFAAAQRSAAAAGDDAAEKSDPQDSEASRAPDRSPPKTSNLSPGQRPERDGPPVRDERDGEAPSGLMRGAQYCARIGQRKVRHSPRR